MFIAYSKYSHKCSTPHKHLNKILEVQSCCCIEQNSTLTAVIAHIYVYIFDNNKVIFSIDIKWRDRSPSFGDQSSSVHQNH